MAIRAPGRANSALAQIPQKKRKYKKGEKLPMQMQVVQLRNGDPSWTIKFLLGKLWSDARLGGGGREIQGKGEIQTQIKPKQIQKIQMKTKQAQMQMRRTQMQKIKIQIYFCRAGRLEGREREITGGRTRNAIRAT